MRAYHGGPSDVATGPRGEVANRRLIEHSATFEPAIHAVTHGVWSVVGHGLSNACAIEAPDGLIVVDTGEGREEAEEQRRAIRSRTDAPVRAVIYSHSHYVNGTSVWTDEASESIEIWGHERIADNRVEYGAEIGPAFARRLMQQFFRFLPADGPDAMPNQGIGPFFFHPSGRRATPGHVACTNTIDAPMDATIAGLRFEFVPAASDSNDTIIIHLPEQATVINNHVWPALFNIYTLRGEPYRDPLTHIAALDIIRDMDPEHLVGVHGVPISGTENVRRALLDYRDSLQFIWDQTVRGINRGLRLRELIEFVELPPRLADSPYVQPFYGEVPFHVRQIHMGLFGWYDGEAADIHPVPARDEAAKVIDGFGGRRRVIDLATAALAADEFSWAARLTTWLVDADHDDGQAKQLKANALRGIARVTTAANTRSMALTEALTLEGVVDPLAATPWRPSRQRVLDAPPERFVKALRVRLDPAKAAGVRDALNVRFPEEGVCCGLEVEDGVARFLPHGHSDPGVTLSLSRGAWGDILAGRASIADAVAQGEIVVDPDITRAQRFFSYFDDAPA